MVHCGDQAVTYRELNERANRLAHHLRALGIGPDARGVICVQRGVEMITAILATWKAGAGYVTIDSAYPAERLAYMLRDSAPSALIMHARLPEDVGAQLRTGAPAAAGWPLPPRTSTPRPSTRSRSPSAP